MERRHLLRTDAVEYFVLMGLNFAGAYLCVQLFTQFVLTLSTVVSFNHSWWIESRPTGHPIYPLEGELWGLLTQTRLSERLCGVGSPCLVLWGHLGWCVNVWVVWAGIKPHNWVANSCHIWPRPLFNTPGGKISFLAKVFYQKESTGAWMEHCDTVV